VKLASANAVAIQLNHRTLPVTPTRINACLTSQSSSATMPTILTSIADDVTISNELDRWLSTTNFKLIDEKEKSCLRDSKPRLEDRESVYSRLLVCDDSLGKVGSRDTATSMDLVSAIFQTVAERRRGDDSLTCLLRAKHREQCEGRVSGQQSRNGSEEIKLSNGSGIRRSPSGVGSFTTEDMDMFPSE